MCRGFDHQTYPPDEPYRTVAVPGLSRPDYLTPVTDPAFGTEIIRITDSAVFGAADVRHHYSKYQSWNCDQTLIKIRNWILDGKTYQIRTSFFMSSEAQWSYKDPNKMFMILGNKFVSINATTGGRTTLYNFADYDTIRMRPSEGNISKNDSTVVFMARNDKDTNIVVYHCCPNVGSGNRCNTLLI